MAAVLFVTGSSSPSTGEGQIISYLTGAGHTVTTREDANATKTGTGYDTVILSPLCSSASVIAYATIPEGTINMVQNTWDDFGMSNATSGISTTAFDNVKPVDHPITTLSGLTAEVELTGSWSSSASGRYARLANLPSGEGAVVAMQGSSAINMFAWAYDTGDLLVDGSTTAPGRRVGVGFADTSFNLASSDVKVFYEAMVRWAGGEDPGGGDTTDPTVSVVLPTADQELSGTVTLRALADDDVAVSSVSFSIDGGGALAASLVGSYWEYALDTTTLSDSSHSITATAVDSSSNDATSSAVNFTVDNTTPDTTDPTVSVFFPAADQELSGTVTLQAAASDDVAVSSVSFSIDSGGALTAVLNGSYWEYTLNTVTLSNDSHSITATAVDSSSNDATSSAVNFTVDNAAPPSGTPTITDDFNRTTLGANWILVAGSAATLSSDRLNVPSSNPWVMAWGVATLATSDAFCRITIYSLSGSVGPVLGIHETTAENYYWLNVSTTEMTLYKLIANSLSIIPDGTFSHTHTSGDIYEIRVEGTTVYAIKNDTIYGSVTDAAHSRPFGQRAVGIRSASAGGSTIDDFAAGDYVEIVPETSTISIYLDSIETELDTTNLRYWDGSQEVGFFYPDGSQNSLPAHSVSYWDGTDEHALTLPDTPNSTPWEGLSYVALGDSSGVVQTSGGVDYVAADLWPELLATSLSTTVTRRHMNSATAQDIAMRMLTSSHAYHWIPGSFELVTLFVGGNDVGFLHESAAGMAGYQHSISAICGLVRTASRVIASSGTLSGTWSSISEGSGGTRSTTLPGDSVTLTFSGTHASVFLLARRDGTGSDFTYAVDGGAPVAGTTEAQADQVELSGTYAPVPIHLRNLASGSHSIVITHTGSSGDPLIVDSVCPWEASAADIPYILIAPPPHAGPGWAVYPSPQPTDSDADVFRGLMRDALLEFAAETKILTVIGDSGDRVFHNSTEDLLIDDDLHPNKRGHEVLADIMYSNLIRHHP